MDFRKEFVEFAKEQLIQNGIKIEDDWDEHYICIMYLETLDRMFDSSIPYRVVFSETI